MTIMAGAGAYWFEGNEAGCLILHGFTGTPQNVRPLADYLARRGLTVSVPRIAGHGTTVQDLDTTGPEDWLGTAEQALADLHSQCATVFVAGISLGGTYTLELARRHQDLAGVVVMAAPVLDLEARGRARATVTRRLCTIAGFYRYVVEEEPLDHSPAPSAGGLRVTEGITWWV